MRKLKNEELDRKSIAEFKAAKKIPLSLILDNIRSLNNIGSVFRTADAFLVEKIYLCGITATPPHRDIHKTALGATDNVAWEYAESAMEVVQKLKEKGHAFVFGNEVRGVSQNVVDACGQGLEIPQYGTKHSLNISVSAGIVLWDFFTKTKLDK